MSNEASSPPARQFAWPMVGASLALATNFATMIWWASQIDGRVQTLEAAARPASTIPEAMARLDERTKVISEQYQRTEERLDVLEGR